MNMWNFKFYVYIMSCPSNSTIYVGVTNNLKRRCFEHKNKLNEGFTKKYNIIKLVYFEHHTNINEAIKREKQIKKWNRAWKNALIEKENPNWEELFDKL
jgi:putative endonuclease